MQDILIILACITAGMCIGYWQRLNALLLHVADKGSMYAVYGLLFILGVRLGADPDLMEKLPVLGTRALCISFFCTAGSVACLSVMRGLVSGGDRGKPEETQAEKKVEKPGTTEVELSGQEKKDAPGGLEPGERVRSGGGSTGRDGTAGAGSPLLGSLRILLAFAAGIIPAMFSLTPAWMADSALATYALYLLVLAVGVGLGANLQAFRILRVLHVRILAVPALIIIGSGLGSAIAALVLPGFGLWESLSVGAGLGYYSLSSILIENAGHSALASVALMSNILREIMAILAAPLLARYCGKITTVGASGATAMDTTLPIIARFSGERVAVIAVFSGMTLTLLVPFLVTATLQWL